MKDNLGYIKENMLNFYNEDENNLQEDLDINQNNIIDTNYIDSNFEYNQSSQQIQNKEDFDYTLLKVIVFLIFV